jgi:hypothetical protein
MSIDYHKLSEQAHDLDAVIHDLKRGATEHRYIHSLECIAGLLDYLTEETELSNINAVLTQADHPANSPRATPTRAPLRKIAISTRDRQNIELSLYEHVILMHNYKEDIDGFNFHTHAGLNFNNSEDGATEESAQAELLTRLASFENTLEKIKQIDSK